MRVMCERRTPDFPARGHGRVVERRPSHRHAWRHGDEWAILFRSVRYTQQTGAVAAAFDVYWVFLSSKIFYLSIDRRRRISPMGMRQGLVVTEGRGLKALTGKPL
jgi:hypothetical protein